MNKQIFDNDYKNNNCKECEYCIILGENIGLCMIDDKNKKCEKNI